MRDRKRKKGRHGKIEVRERKAGRKGGREGGKKYNTKEKKADLWQLRTEILNNVNMTRTGGTRIKH